MMRPAAVVLAAMLAVGNGAEWEFCAEENQDCIISTDEFVTIRFGGDGHYSYFMMQGIAKFECNIYWGRGDPKLGKKQCDIIVYNFFFAPIWDRAGWTEFFSPVGEGLPVLNTSPELRWVRYGHGNSWTYSFIEGNSASILQCVNDNFGVDPKSRVGKMCQIGPEMTAAYEGFTTCGGAAPNDAECAMGSVSSVVRFKSHLAAVTRVLSFESGSFTCSSLVFGFDPHAGAEKHCDYATIQS
ncbi:hypothetical protein DIPPA_32253 [Diplonema papillatum]|nr:hypothetical protein DIPPA_32253 [Diplonema papillatum]|eukprot:gene17498-26925_t